MNLNLVINQFISTQNQTCACDLYFQGLIASFCDMRRGNFISHHIVIMISQVVIHLQHKLQLRPNQRMWEKHVCQCFHASVAFRFKLIQYLINYCMLLMNGLFQIERKIHVTVIFSAVHTPPQEGMNDHPYVIVKSFMNRINYI